MSKQHVEGEFFSRKPFSRKPMIAPPLINVTPMIDVLLVLLIIFMIIAPTRPAKFQAQVPSKPETGGPPPPVGLLMVVVKSGSGLDQMVELNSTSIRLPELALTLRDVLEGRPDRTVYLKAPRNKPYGDILAVIDAIKGAGASPIGLQIDFLD
jgi:biopolymer transport protein ExbD